MCAGLFSRGRMSVPVEAQIARWWLRWRCRVRCGSSVSASGVSVPFHCRGFEEEPGVGRDGAGNEEVSGFKGWVYRLGHRVSRPTSRAVGWEPLVCMEHPCHILKNRFIEACYAIYDIFSGMIGPAWLDTIVKFRWSIPVWLDRRAPYGVALVLATVLWLACAAPVWAGPCPEREDCREAVLDGGELPPGQAGRRVFHCAGEAPYLAGWERTGSPCVSVSSRAWAADTPGRLEVKAQNWCLEAAGFGVALACLPVRPACGNAGDPERDPGCPVTRTGTICLERLEGGGCREGRAWLEECSDGRVYDCGDAGPSGRPCRQCR